MLAVAMILDGLLGESRWLRFGLPHPVVAIGSMISALEKRMNLGSNRKAKGVFALIILLFIGLLASVPLKLWQFGWIFEILLAAILIAQRSLVDHVQAVAEGLRVSLEVGRAKVAMIVGRDPGSLDESGVARAAIESAAENFSDGVAAPIFWFAVAGLPGILIYKIVNTADSMVGHRNERYIEFGWASARLDDILNFIPARLTGLIFALVGPSLYALNIMQRDAPKHRSPNAGWPEGAMAALLNVALAGPRKYDDVVVDDPYIHPEGSRECGPDDVERSVMVLWRSWQALLICAVLMLLVQRSLM